MLYIKTYLYSLLLKLIFAIWKQQFLKKYSISVVWSTSRLVYYREIWLIDYVQKRGVNINLERPKRINFGWGKYYLVKSRKELEFLVKKIINIRYVKGDALV